MGLYVYSIPGGYVGGVSVAPGSQAFINGEAGVAGVEGPVVADGDQGPAVGDEARVGKGVGYEGSIGAVVRIQVGNGGAVLRRRGQGQQCGQSGRREDHGDQEAGSVHRRLLGRRLLASLQSTSRGPFGVARLIPKVVSSLLLNPLGA